MSTLTLYLLLSYAVFLFLMGFISALLIDFFKIDSGPKDDAKLQILAMIHLLLLWFVFFGLPIVIDYLPTR